MNGLLTEGWKGENGSRTKFLRETPSKDLAVDILYERYDMRSVDGAHLYGI